MLISSPILISERLSAITRLLDSSANGAGAILVYSGERPPPFDSPSSINVQLAKVILKKPSLGEIKGKVLTFAPIESCLVVSSGKAIWARMVNADGLIIADMDVGIDGDGADLTIRKEDGSAADSTQLYAGGEFSVSLAQLIES